MIRVAVLLLLPVMAWGQEAAEIVATHGIPAAVVATWTPEGRSVDVAGHRFAGGPAVTPTDPWHVGSLGKAMTATLAARLVADGRIAWDDTAGALLDAPAPWADVTLAAFLSHRSGMDANLPRWRTVLRPDRAAYVAAMLRRAPAGPRGVFLYSNAGYVVAGAMMEAAAGASWEDLMAAEVFAPLGMAGAGFGAPDPGPRGHRNGAAVAPGPRADNLPAMGPAGTIHLTPDDMLRFLAAHATADPAYLPPALWARLHMPVGDYAMGWAVDDGVLRHLGSNTLWFAGMRIDAAGAAFVAVNAGDGAAREAVVRALDARP
ncbi:MAG: serine hydrolase domain-containing protein [Pseudomonadota bacterium]